MNSKQLYFLAFMFFMVRIVSAQHNIRTCAYHGYQTVEGDGEEDVSSLCDLYNGTSGGANTEEAIASVDAILDKVGLFRNFSVEECEGINNAIAVTVPLENGDMDRFILFDHLFFKQVSSNTGTNWGLVSILAHEVGHHLNGHTLRSGGSNHQIELQADEFSGFVLGRMGCTLDDAQSAVSKMLPDEPSITHPAKVDRLTAIAKGWSRGSGKTIAVKAIDKTTEEKIVNNQVTTDELNMLVTPEQVLAKYIEAIGGEEKVREIKTLEVSMKGKYDYGNADKMTKKMAKMSGMSEGMTYHQIFLTPTKIATSTKMGKTETRTLNLDGKIYIKVGKDGWTSNTAGFSQDTKVKSTSYIFEYSALVNNPEMKLLPSEDVTGESCYVVQFPTWEFYQDEKLISTMEQIRYYSVQTGLLLKSVMVGSFPNMPTNKQTTTVYYKDYHTETGLIYSCEDFMEIVQEGTPEIKTVYENYSVKINPILDERLFNVN